MTDTIPVVATLAPESISARGQEIELAVDGLDTGASVDSVLSAMMKVAAIKEWVRQQSETLDMRVVEWIQANGEIVNGTVRWYVGPKRKTILAKLAEEALRVLIEQKGIEHVAQNYLSANWFKHGAIKDEMPDEYKLLFTVIEEPELKEGKAKPQKIDTRFLK